MQKHWYSALVTPERAETIAYAVFPLLVTHAVWLVFAGVAWAENILTSTTSNPMERDLLFYGYFALLAIGMYATLREGRAAYLDEFNRAQLRRERKGGGGF